MKSIKIVLVIAILFICNGVFADNSNPNTGKDSYKAEMVEKISDSEETEEEEDVPFKIYGVSNSVILTSSEHDLVNMDGFAIDKTYFFEDLEVGLKARLAKGLKAYATISLGNYMDFIDGISDSEDIKIIPYYMYLGYENERFGKLNAGVIPFQVNSYVMERADDDTYAEIERMENGNYAIVGADYEVNINDFDLKAWGYTAAKFGWHDATLVDRYIFGDTKYNFGTQLKYNFLNDISVSALFAAIAADDSHNKANIYGGNVNVPFNNFFLDFNYYYESLNDDAKMFFENSYNMDIRAGYSDDIWNAFAGYRAVQADYDAPGAWDPSGVAANFTNVKGFYVEAEYVINERFTTYGFYKNYTPEDRDFDNNGNIYDFSLGLNYNISEGQDVWAEFERVSILDGNESSNYYSLGWKKAFTDNLNLRLFYQYIDNDFGGDKNKGSLFNAQLAFAF